MTDVGSSNKIDILTNGNITLTESLGDLRIGTIISTKGNVTLTATDASASIFDVPVGDDNVADLTGNRVTLTAATGGIGTLANFLEINSSNQATGSVTIVAQDGVYLKETSGAINVASIVSKLSDVVIIADGSILESGSDIGPEIQATSIDLESKKRLDRHDRQ